MLIPNIDHVFTQDEWLSLSETERIAHYAYHEMIGQAWRRACRLSDVSASVRDSIEVEPNAEIPSIEAIWDPHQAATFILITFPTELDIDVTYVDE